MPGVAENPIHRSNSLYVASVLGPLNNLVPIKYVRKDHVQNNHGHWTTQKITKNELKDK